MTIRQRATLDDVARLAHVSPKTVSRVFSQRHLVSPATAEAVLAAAKRLKFRPNTVARNLRGGASNTVGFVIGELLNPFYSTVATGLERVLADNGKTLIVASTDDTAEGEERVADTLLAQRVAALLMVPVGEDQSYLEGERQLGCPVISIDRPARNLVADSVVLENRTGAFSATRSLMARGHRKIAYICNPAAVYTQAERIQGYREAIASGGRAEPTPWERLLDDPAANPAAVVADLLAMDDAPTAIIAGNNRMCIGALQVLDSLEHPPALIGFDDFDTADILGVSVVSHDAVDMGRQAAELALERIMDPTGFTRQIIIPTKLIHRGSGEHPPYA
ncbi:LacI family DNA-binding transcriptional regulator [Glutamicibacter mysorens]